MREVMSHPPPEVRPPKSLRDLRRLVEETAAVTGSALPGSLDADAPTLEESALGAADGDSLYFIGLIGGKNVGKSSLINALVGRRISSDTSHGPGTEKAIAYVHETQAEAVRKLLDREVPGRYELIAHALPHLARQVLLDLPDVDSHFEGHLEVTRRMLRHMLYPIWLQSVDKYADRQPRELLLKVTAGNTPRNFIFVLNKVDQLVAREGEQAARELCDDYAARIGTALGLDAAPHVWMISATHPDQHDLPALQELVGQQKSTEMVASSRQGAVLQQSHALLAWFDHRQLPEQISHLVRLEERANETIMEQVAGPVIEQILPGLMDDRSIRAALADEVMHKRVARWPIVNILHVLLDAIVSALRLRLPYGQQWAFEGADALVVRRFAMGRGALPAAMQGAFARLQQSDAALSRLYAERRYWDDLSADAAIRELQQNLAAAIEHQRQSALARLTRGWGPAGWLARIALTIGAVLWFPIVQPVLEAMLHGSAARLSLLVVQVLGVNYLLKSVGFLCVYFVLLWLFLKWRTRQQTEGWFERWKRCDPLNPEQSLTGQVLEWSRRLTDPIRGTRERLEALISQAEELRAAFAPQ